MPLARMSILVTWTRGRHIMKFGGLAIRGRYNGNSINYPAYGTYNFSGLYSAGPGSV